MSKIITPHREDVHKVAYITQSIKGGKKRPKTIRK